MATPHYTAQTTGVFHLELLSSSTVQVIIIFSGCTDMSKMQGSVGRSVCHNGGTVGVTQGQIELDVG